MTMQQAVDLHIMSNKPFGFLRDEHDNDAARCGNMYINQTLR